MKLIKKITSISLTLLVLLFFSAPMLNSCGGKNKSTESTEQATEEGEEHPAGEHPAGDDEHPAGEEHPDGDEDHPSGEEHPDGDEDHPTSDTTDTE